MCTVPFLNMNVQLFCPVLFFSQIISVRWFRHQRTYGLQILWKQSTGCMMLGGVCCRHLPLCPRLIFINMSPLWVLNRCLAVRFVLTSSVQPVIIPDHMTAFLPHIYMIPHCSPEVPHLWWYFTLHFHCSLAEIFKYLENVDLQMIHKP